MFPKCVEIYGTYHSKFEGYESPCHPAKVTRVEEIFFLGKESFGFAAVLFFKDKNPSCQHFHLPSSCVFQFFFLLLIIFIFRVVTSKDIFVSLAVETLEITMWKSGLSFSFFFRCFFFSTVQKTWRFSSYFITNDIISSSFVVGRSFKMEAIQWEWEWVRRVESRKASSSKSMKMKFWNFIFVRLILRSVCVKKETLIER